MNIKPNVLSLCCVAGLALGVLLAWGCKRAGDSKSSSEPVAEVKPLPPPDPGIAPATRALWVWDTHVVTTEVARVEFMEACAKHKISTLFLNMSPFPNNQYNQAYIQQLKSFNKGVHNAGMKVNALRVMPMSVKLIYPKGHYVAVTYLRDFLIFNNNLAEDERFDGYILDLEPQTLAGWAENKQEIQRSFVDFVLEMRKTVIEFQQGLQLGWAMLPDFDEYEWLAEVYGYLDFVVLRGYSDEGDQLVSLSGDEMKLGAATGTRVVLSLQTKNMVDDEGTTEDLTFYEEGLGQMESVMGAVSKQLQGESAFGGFVIVDYQGLMSMPSWEPLPSTGEGL